MGNSDFLLFVGPKNLSTWTLRAWLLLKHYGIPFEEELFDYNTADGKTALKESSPSGWVPVLWHEGLPVWDTLSIAEYLNELFPEHQMWPANARARSGARSITAEMHSGFSALRNEMPMAFLETREVTPSADCQRDVARIQEVWTDCRAVFGAGGPFLFGRFSIADAFYAPVVSRFRTYGVPCEGAAAEYMETMWALPAMQEWGRGAAVEVE